MHLRAPEPPDAAAVAGLLTELGYPAEARAVWPRLARLVSCDDYCVLLAEEDGSAVGLGAVHVFPVIHADNPVAMLSVLIVTAHARGRGLGRALVQALEEYARGAACTRMIVASGLARADAHAFYEQVGFIFDARRYAKVLKGSSSARGGVHV